MRPSIPATWVPQQAGLGKSQFSLAQGVKTMQHFTATLYLDHPALPCSWYGSLGKVLAAWAFIPEFRSYQHIESLAQQSLSITSVLGGGERRNPRVCWPANPGTKPKILRCWLPGLQLLLRFELWCASVDNEFINRWKSHRSSLSLLTSLSLSLSPFSFWGTGDQIHCLFHIRDVLYHWAKPPAEVLFQRLMLCVLIFLYLFFFETGSLMESTALQFGKLAYTLTTS